MTRALGRGVGFMLVVVLGSASCDRGDPFDRALAEMRALRTRMCACPDLACADTVHADYEAWFQRTRTRLTGPGHVTAKPLQERRGRAIKEAIRQCRRQLDGRGSLP